MDNPVDLKQLQDATNAEEGFVQTHEEPTPEAKEAEPASQADGESVSEATPPQGQAQPDDIGKKLSEYEEQFKALSETPYKSLPDIVKGYKELQSQFTRESERVKPFKDVIQRAETDFALRQYLTQALQAYDHPEMLAAYQQPEPKAENYDLFTPEGQQKFMADTRAHYERAIDTRISSRLQQVEQQAKMEQAKSEFRSKYPNENPDEVIQFAREKGSNWTLEDVHKIKTFDSVKSKALEEARKELTKQLETAQKSGTPQASAPPKQSVRLDDILTHISRYGTKSARAKFGDQKVVEAMSEAA